MRAKNICRFFKIKKGHQNGLNLVELMIVVAIISIVGAIAIPRFTEHFQKVRLTEARKMIKYLKESIEIYRSENDGSFLLLDTNGIEIPIGNLIGNNQINMQGLYLKIPDNSYFEYFISNMPYAGIDASIDNLRIGARHPYGSASNSASSLTLITNEQGYITKYKLRDSTEFQSY